MGSSTSPVPQWEHEDPQPPNRDTGTLISVLGPPEPPQPYSGDPVVWGHDPLLISLPTGRGGASIYGKHFEDELHSELKFTGEISVPKPHLYVSKRKKKKPKKNTDPIHISIHSFLHPSPGAGILAMANAGPDTNGSQFFITLAPAQWLDGKHTIFGRVCQGIGVLGRVGMVETNAQDRPLDDVKVLKAVPAG